MSRSFLGHVVEITLAQVDGVGLKETVRGVLQRYDETGATISRDARSMDDARFFPAHRIVEIQSRGRAP